jgi:hypothetical protein
MVRTWPPAGLDVHEPAARLDKEISKPGRSRRRRAWSVSGDRAPDEPRIATGEGRAVEDRARLSWRVGAVHDDISGAGERVERAPVGGVMQVEHNAALSLTLTC